MKEYNHQLPLISVHVPKCGGLSLSRILRYWFGKKLFLHYYDEENNKMPDKVRLKRFFLKTYKPDLCIHGHFNKTRGLGLDVYYPEVQQVITFLRDPVEMQLSLFYYHQRLTKLGKDFRYGKQISITKDIDEFLENSQPYLKLHFPDNLNADTLEFYFSDYFVHVGIIERYQESLDILADKLKKPRIIIPHENRSERYLRPSDSSIKKFKENCQFEYQFYNRGLREH